MKEINFITQNRGKVAELRAKATQFDLKINHIDASYPELQADALEDVVRYGLAYCQNKFPAPFIIEDSGLFVDALRGFPGPFSSYVYRTIGNSGLVKLVGAGAPARFESLIGSYDNDFKLFRGQVKGCIVTSRGRSGFGFDPIFEHDGRTFGEITIDEKNAISHRSKAAELFVKWATTVI
ncbi:MAG: non-canonical purine NTP pyrophosphatase [Euryarchaeota archaeon]|nr:non-canonical purine NTP pyrophosphatase [Euryarchaeota archaeon]